MRLIDADALKQWIKDVWDWDRLDDLTTSTVLRQTLSDIDDQPTADVPQWIPCSEGLPSIETDVLLTSWNGKNQYVGWMDAFLKWHSEDEEVISGYEPIAWMPLPEPWKGEAE